MISPEDSLLGLNQDFPRNIGKPWDLEERSRLVDLYNKGTNPERIAHLLRRSVYTIEYQIDKIMYCGQRRFLEDYHSCILPSDWANEQQKQTTKETTMSKPNHLISLLQNDFTTVEVLFPNSNSSYTYKVPLSMVQEGLKPLDMVVVPARSGFSVATVYTIHDSPQIDLDAPFEYRWIVQKVDTTAYDTRILREREFTESMKAIEKEKRKAEALEDFKKFLPADALPLLDGAVAKLNSAE